MDHSELLSFSGLSMYTRGIHIIKLVHFSLSISLLLQVGLSQETRSIKLFFFPFTGFLENKCLSVRVQ